MILSGTGSRQLEVEPLEKQQEIYNLIYNHVIQNNYKYIMSGGAEGFDRILAQVAIDLKIPLYLAIPNKTYGEYYYKRKSLTKTNNIDKFNYLLTNAFHVIYVCASIFENGIHSNFVRNFYMVKFADNFLVYGPSTPGTRHALKLIEEAKKPYIILE